VRRPLATVLLASLLGVACSGGHTDAQSCTKSSGVDGPSGKALPATTFTRFDGSPATFADYTGKPLVVNFFASWCGPCVREMPGIESLHKQLGDKVTFLGMDTNDRLEDGKRLVEATKVTYDLALDKDGSIIVDLGGIGMPTTFLVDRQGRVVASHTGELKPATLDCLIKQKIL
jgi:thiol-disulfide isomerase/thioredoxin